MKTITLNILAEDIKTSCYTNSDDCALTRSVKRYNPEFKGLPCGVEYNGHFVRYPDEERYKVRRMYHSSPDYQYKDQVTETEKLEDFSFSLEVPDNW